MQIVHKAKNFRTEHESPNIINLGKLGSANDPRIRRIEYYHGKISEDDKVKAVEIWGKEYIPDLHTIYTDKINDKVILIECYKRPNALKIGEKARPNLYEKAL